MLIKEFALEAINPKENPEGFGFMFHAADKTAPRQRGATPEELSKIEEHHVTVRSLVSKLRDEASPKLHEEIKAAHKELTDAIAKAGSGDGQEFALVHFVIRKPGGPPCGTIDKHVAVTEEMNAMSWLDFRETLFLAAVMLWHLDA